MNQFAERDNRLQKVYCDALAIFLEYEDYKTVIMNISHACDP